MTAVAAKYILAVLSLAFLLAGVTSVARSGRKAAVQARTWLLIGVIFGAVSTWLWLHG